MSQKSLLVCFYDDLGNCPVSYQIYKSDGDFYRSIVQASQDKSLPFCNYPYDYSVHILGNILDLSVVPTNDSSNHFTFSQVQTASKGMDTNINFNTKLFIQRLIGVISDDIDELEFTDVKD